MARYTIIMDWDGGTYLEQAHGRTADVATVRWAQDLDVAPISGMGASAKEQLICEIGAEDGVPIDGLQNVWWFSAIVRGKLALVHTVRTEAQISG